MLQVTDLDVFYGDAQALWGASVTVGSGEVVSIVGSNGAGKSTLVNAIMGILRPRRGRIVLDDQDVTETPGHRMCRAGVAIVPEGRRLFPSMSVEDNLDLGAFNRVARAHYEESLQWVHTLFPRLADRRSQLAGSLSGGEQQMLAIGRSLMTDPRLLLMDEPSEGLAPAVLDLILDRLLQIKLQGQAVMLAEQNVDLALEVADRVCILGEAGAIGWSGPPATLRDNPAILRELVGL